MREILFRGKCVDNGVWIEGDLLTSTDIIDCTEISLNTGVGDRYDVDPDTVGQFTGLTDKNGKRIFEGDIVSHKGQIYEIKYSTKQARFLALLSNGVFNPVVMQNCEVIGNVHDNPEMLEHPQQ